jgi:hypothetical protein
MDSSGKTYGTTNANTEALLESYWEVPEVRTHEILLE